MRIHHLNCGTFCPRGGRLFDGFSKGYSEARLVCHCLLIESNQGLILVDTGLGMRDVDHPRPRLSPFFLGLLRPRLQAEETALHQIRQLGFRPEDVRHIVLTHLDFDHAGGIEDFPHAQVHLLEAGRQAVQHRNTPIAQGRYRPDQFEGMQNWNTYPISQGERWYGFESVRDLKGLPPEILLVPLIGHTEGHTGVAIRSGEGWLLHCGDAYFYRDEMNPERHGCTPGLRAYQWMMEVDRGKRLGNQRRLRELAGAHGNEVKLFSAHDPLEFLAWTKAETRLPAEEDVVRHFRQVG